jgi:hypothetical protein
MVAVNAKVLIFALKAGREKSKLRFRVLKL